MRAVPRDPHRGERQGSRPGRGARRLARRVWRFGNPLSWSSTDKCLLVAVITLVATVLFVVMVRTQAGWPYLPPDINPKLMAWLNRIIGWAVAPWLAMLAVLVLIRRRVTHSAVLMHATAQLYAVTIALFAYLTGPFYSPGWIAFLGGAVMGFILLGRLATVLAVVTFFGVMVGAIVAGQYELLPYAPMINSGTLANVSGELAVRLAVSSLLFSVVVLGMAGYVIARWHGHERRLEELSRTDPLTRVTNRRHFMHLFELEFARARRYGTSLSAIMLDLDHFKRVNDEHGHLVGDQVLVAAAAAIQSGLRGHDVVARYGGEEFVVLLPSTDAAGAREVAERCRKLVGEMPILAGQTVLRVTASLGAVSFPHAEVQRTADLLRLADEALYRAKAEGRNRTVAVA